MTIYAICESCGGYLDRDQSICRQCGADNDPNAEPEETVQFTSDHLDRLKPWSLIKHEIIEKYAGAYTRILHAQSWTRRIVYIDAFAGAGVAIDAESDQLIAAGARRALDVEPPFTEYHFIERRPEKVTLLKGITAHRQEASVHHGDFEAILPSLLSRCRYNDYARGLCLLDPYGLSVSYELLEQIAAAETIDLFFNFMLMSANRNVLWNVNPSQIAPQRKAMMTRAWGHDRWADDLYRSKGNTLFDEVEKVSNAQVIEAYRGRLKAAGFKYVPEPVAMRNSTNAPVYYLFFCSPKDVAGHIALDIFNRYR